MIDAEHLSSDHPAAPSPVAIAADVVLLTLDERSLKLLLVERGEQPARGRLALPGVFVRADEELDAAATRALRIKAGLDAPVRQFHAFGQIDRDPRQRVVSVAYAALLPLAAVRPVLDTRRRLVIVRDGVCRGDNGRKVALPFDHAAIVAGALADLRAGLDTTTWSFGLLPREFSLRELQHVHEAIRGEPLNKPSFRKRMIDSGRLVATGRREADTRFRPAEFYRLREELPHAR